MIGKLIIAVIVAVVVTLGCVLVGEILTKLSVEIAVTIGEFLADHSAVLGILSGLYYFFVGGFALPKH